MKSEEWDDRQEERAKVEIHQNNLMSHITAIPSNIIPETSSKENPKK